MSLILPNIIAEKKYADVVMTVEKVFNSKDIISAPPSKQMGNEWAQKFIELGPFFHHLRR